MKISTHIRNLWREVEDILTAATGPLLIVSSAISTSDIFSNSTFSHLIPQLPAIWAIGRALAVTMWLGIAFEYYLEDRRRGEPGFWWFLLSMLLFVVDLQTATLFAFQAEHISNLGEWSALQIPPIDWAIEQAVLGVILIAVHRAVIHNVSPALHAASSTVAVTAPPLARSNVQAADSAVLRRDAPAARRAYHHGAVAPIIMEGSNEDVYDPIRYVSEDAPDEPDTPRERPAPSGVTRRTHSRRSDSGRSAADVAARRARLLELLYVDPKMSISQIMAAIDVKSRPTAVSYRDAARRQLINQYPEREADWRAAWGEAWEKLV